MKNLLLEKAGVSFIVRKWATLIEELLKNNEGDRLIVDGQEYPELFKDFSEKLAFLGVQI